MKKNVIHHDVYHSSFSLNYQSNYFSPPEIISNQYLLDFFSPKKEISILKFFWSIYFYIKNVTQQINAHAILFLNLEKEDKKIITFSKK